jgi:hypothetical protein
MPLNKTPGRALAAERLGQLGVSDYRTHLFAIGQQDPSAWQQGCHQRICASSNALLHLCILARDEMLRRQCNRDAWRDALAPDQPPTFTTAAARAVCHVGDCIGMALV